MNEHTGLTSEVDQPDWAEKRLVALLLVAVGIGLFWVGYEFALISNPDEQPAENVETISGSALAAGLPSGFGIDFDSSLPDILVTTPASRQLQELEDEIRMLKLMLERERLKGEINVAHRDAVIAIHRRR